MRINCYEQIIHFRILNWTSVRNIWVTQSRLTSTWTHIKINGILIPRVCFCGSGRIAIFFKRIFWGRPIKAKVKRENPIIAISQNDKISKWFLILFAWSIYKSVFTGSLFSMQRIVFVNAYRASPFACNGTPAWMNSRFSTKAILSEKLLLFIKYVSFLTISAQMNTEDSRSWWWTRVAIYEYVGFKLEAVTPLL